MHFKRKKTKTRWMSPDGCIHCATRVRQLPSELTLRQSDRRRYQSTSAQLRCDATGSRLSFRYQHKNLTGIIIE
jgi:hypothetical protein